jgi:hypothetical protein
VRVVVLRSSSRRECPFRRVERDPLAQIAVASRSPEETDMRARRSFCAARTPLPVFQGGKVDFFALLTIRIY